MEVYPSLAFDSLFDNRGSQRNLEHSRSRERARPQSLSRQVSSTDKAKLDEYLTSVREVEKRIDRDAERQGTGRRPRASRGIVRPHDGAADNGLPEDIREHMRLMCDIIALAFQTDKTRIASLLLAAICRRCITRSSTCGRAPRRLARRPVGRLRAHLALSSEPARLSRRRSSTRCRRAMARCSTTPA